MEGTEAKGSPAGKEKKKPTSHLLRERMGGVPKELTQRHKERQERGRKIVKALREGPKTVPEIAGATEIPAYRVLWHVMSLKKYGKVVEGEEQDSYFQYMLKETEK
jgi:hypothetical protein